MAPPSSGPPLPFPNLFAASAVAACSAEVRCVRRSPSNAARAPPAAPRRAARRARPSPFSRARAPMGRPRAARQIMTLPLDTAKVRLQLQGGGGKYK